MSVDEDRQATARERRANIIAALNQRFDMDEPTSPVRRFSDLAHDKDHPRLVIANADIDGLLGAQMLASVTGWEIAALIDRAGQVRVQGDYRSLVDIVESGQAFGVDVFSPLFPNVSNHPIHFGSRVTQRVLRERLDRFDAEMDTALETHGIINLSAWVKIAATGKSGRSDGMPYKYPLGSAHEMLALLELAGLNPRLYDREYLPWLLANCDGGLDTIRTYPWNAELWWSALAARVGPASLSESIYQIAITQRPNQATDVDRRLRYDEKDRSEVLTTKWNLKNAEPETVETFVSLVRDLSGWPDPFRGGVAGLATWATERPSARVLPVKGITRRSTQELETHLASASLAVNANFSVFRERGAALGWMLPNVNPAAEELLPGDQAEELVALEEPSVQDTEAG
ncbi:hypothetical protein [Georgenia yuyongxinii]|uniref:Uncharacterized protein n=1 Tax=Georgenia yuyongxinii TaxID=2589797 RepID=A0A552WU43_9MICO|nr:hypothetical protein [Georgenia yuyongxinii]TRW46370.1 hypothetical protein FJ693_05440 [Georgenia yuyongxinii]